MVATARFIAEIMKSHTVVAYVDVYGPTGLTGRLIVTGGDITVDRTAQYRRGGKLRCIDPLGTFTAGGTGGILTPFGTELLPYRGVRYSDGTEEVYPLGVFRLSKATVGESGSQTGGGNGAGIIIDLEMFDLSRAVSRNKFVDTYTIPDGTNVIAAIQTLLARTFPGLDYDSISTTLNTSGPTVYNAGDDPWAAVVALGSSIGCDVYFDVNGTVVIAPSVDMAALGNPVYTYIEGNGSTMTALSAVYADDPGYNGVIVVGSSTSSELAPVRAESWDNNPGSPTYQFGPYGQVPLFVNDTNISTAVDAQAAADATLKGILGFGNQLTVIATPNPSLEAGDVVQIERSILSASGLYVIDSFDIPMLASAESTLLARQQQVAD